MIDFLIIGGGIAGASAAGSLSELGSVTLLEAEDAFGYQATGRSAAMFLETYGNAAVRALNSASAPAHRDMGVLSPRGLLMVARADQTDAFIREQAILGGLEISPKEAIALFPILNPDFCAKASYQSNVYDVDTDRMLQHYLRLARANGADLHCSSRVNTIHRQEGHWQVETDAGNFETRHLVNASGAWADQIAQAAGLKPLGIQPFRRSMARLPIAGSPDMRSWPMVLDVLEDWYAKPDAGSLLVSPADEDATEPQDAWADDMVIAEGLARYQPFVTEEVTRVTATWAGLRSFAPDRTLVIGPDPEEPTFLWCAGQGGYGFQTAPAAARLLADLVSGRPPELRSETVNAILPDRLRT